MEDHLQPLVNLRKPCQASSFGLDRHFRHLHFFFFPLLSPGASVYKSGPRIGTDSRSYPTTEAVGFHDDHTDGVVTKSAEESPISTAVTIIQGARTDFRASHPKTGLLSSAHTAKGEFADIDTPWPRTPFSMFRTNINNCSLHTTSFLFRTSFDARWNASGNTVRC